MYAVLHGLKHIWRNNASHSVIQRIYICKRTDSIPPVSSKHLPTQPLPVYSNYLTVWQSRRGERLGGQMFGRRRGGAVPSLTNIYSLVLYHTHCIVHVHSIQCTVHVLYYRYYLYVDYYYYYYFCMLACLTKLSDPTEEHYVLLPQDLSILASYSTENHSYSPPPHLFIYMYCTIQNNNIDGSACYLTCSPTVEHSKCTGKKET